MNYRRMIYKLSYLRFRAANKLGLKFFDGPPRLRFKSLKNKKAKKVDGHIVLKAKIYAEIAVDINDNYFCDFYCGHQCGRDCTLFDEHRKKIDTHWSRVGSCQLAFGSALHLEEK